MACRCVIFFSYAVLGLGSFVLALSFFYNTFWLFFLLILLPSLLPPSLLPPSLLLVRGGKEEWLGMV